MWRVGNAGPGRGPTSLFERYAFTALRPLAADRPAEESIREVHAFVGPRFLGTFRFGPDPFPIDRSCERWERQPELLAQHGGGFAAWALIDEVVDGYLSEIEAMEDRADLHEDDVFGELTVDAGTICTSGSSASSVRSCSCNASCRRCVRRSICSRRNRSWCRPIFSRTTAT